MVAHRASLLPRLSRPNPIAVELRGKYGVSEGVQCLQPLDRPRVGARASSKTSIPPGAEGVQAVHFGQAGANSDRYERMGGATQVLLRLVRVVVLGAASGMLASGCGAADHRAQGARTPVATVTERDFSIEAPSTLKAGEAVLQVRNHGPDEHELIIAPLGRSGLPIRTDGFTVNEQAIERSEPGSLEPGQPGSVRDLRVRLSPGRYVFFCNMEGHYLGGMHTTVVVTQ
jgi:uncharacterized cupredoxin-like copper-binding protein